MSVLRSCIISAVLATLSVAPAFPQFSAAIQGVVTDKSDSVVPGVAIRVTNVATGVSRDVTSSDEGLYRVLSLNPGIYRVEASKTGFQPLLRDQVEISVSQTARLDLQLVVGGVAEKVTVQEQAPLVETEQGRVSNRIDQVQMKDLPLNGRNVFNLIALQPGVLGRGNSNAMGVGGTANDPFAGEAYPDAYASGNRKEGNNFTLDDNSTNSLARGGNTNLTPNADSVEEVRVVANNFSAADGFATGAQFQVVSKQGTNVFHGGASYFGQYNAMRARKYIEATIPVFRRNQFAYHLGGPIRKNRTFFFTSYEGLRGSGTGAAVATVETPEFRDWVHANRAGSIADKLLQQFRPVSYPTYGFSTNQGTAPQPGETAPPATMAIYGNAIFNPQAYRNGNQFSTRIDHELRPGKDRLYGNFFRTTAQTLNGGVRPDFNRPEYDTTWFASLNETHTFGPSMVNELSGNMMRLVGLPQYGTHPEVPSISGFFFTGFGSNAFPQGWFQTSFNYKDVFSWVHSSHTIKIGGEFRRLRANSKNTTNYIPSYSFNNSIVDFAWDNPYSETRKVDPHTGTPAQNEVGLRDAEFSAFVNDDWKARRNLTITLGVRYENFGSPYEVNNMLRNIVLGSGSDLFTRLGNASAQVVPNLFPRDNNNFAPRVGFAWDPKGDGKTSVRGGYGISYDRWFMTPLLNFRDTPPLRADVTLSRQFGNTGFKNLYAIGDLTKPDQGFPIDPGLQQGLDAHNGIVGRRVAVSLAVGPNVRSPYVHNWFLGVQHELHGGLLVEMNLVGTAGHHQPVQANDNRFAGDLLNGGVFHGFNSSFSNINYLTTDTNSIYNGGTMMVKKRFAAGLYLQGAFTYGKVISQGDSLVDGTINYLDVNNRGLERGLANFDARRKLAFMSVWEMPFLRGKTGLLPMIVAGWQLSGMGIIQDGNPMTVYNSGSYGGALAGGDWNGDGTGGDRPNGPTTPIQTSGWSRSDFLAGIFPNKAVFGIPALGTDGTLGRNTFRGPGFAQIDMSLGKQFRISERFSSRLQLDAFNALNRVNLNNPSTDLNNVNFGKSLDQAAPRVFQAGLRVTF